MSEVMAQSGNLDTVNITIRDTELRLVPLQPGGKKAGQIGYA
jgi:hypothetical protein